MQTSEPVEGVGCGLVRVPYLNTGDITPRRGRRVQVEVFPCDTKLSIKRGPRQKPMNWTRGDVKEFSDRSRGRLLFAAFNADVKEWFAFVTLTYPKDFPANGKTVKAHLHKFLVYMSRECPGIKYLAAMEFQKRGAPHFHMLVDKFIDLAWLSETWYRVVGSGDEKHLRAGTQVQLVRSRGEGAAYMASVYQSKVEQKKVPEGFSEVGRFWFGSRRLVVAVRKETIFDYREGVEFIRTMRRFTEKGMRSKRVQPVDHTTGAKRKRKVKRKPVRILKNSRCGFTSLRSAGVAGRLIDERHKGETPTRGG